MKTTIRLAVDAAELEALYTFRYRIYVEEMNRVQKYADHQRMTICDPLDLNAHNLVAWAGPTIVGCVRVNRAVAGGLDYYRDLLAMDRSPCDYPSGVSLCTRLMIEPTYRGGSLALQLCIASFELAVKLDIQWNFIDCNDHLVGFFRKLGYVWTHRALHDEYGAVNAMRLELHDAAHLKACRSPFLNARSKRIRAAEQPFVVGSS